MTRGETSAVDYFVRRAEDIAEASWINGAMEGADGPTGRTHGSISGPPGRTSRRRAGCEPYRMVSGAGHDAMIMAEKVPSAMIFLRTPGGISHDPAESVSNVEDVARRSIADAFAGSVGDVIRISIFARVSGRTNRA
jgi:hypothetical protein